MKIASAQIQFSASHFASSSTETQETLRAWRGAQRPNFEAQERALSSAAAENQNGSTPLQLSDAARQALQNDNSNSAPSTDSAQAINNASDSAIKDPRIKLLKSIIEMMLKRKIDLFDSSSLTIPQTGVSAPATTNPDAPAAQSSGGAGYGVEYSYRQTHSETEQTSFSAEGQIKTADGASIQFSVSLEMNRSFTEETNISINFGDARKVKDPLVINFDGTAAQLTDQKFSFDLNNSGTDQTISFVAGNKGFLALDKNGNGKIDNGSELFGPASGNGFQDLAAYDSDHNNWIDENDSVFNRLRIWTKDSAGNDSLHTLKDKNIGALYLGSIDTPFTLNNSNQEQQGQLRQTGIFLQEDGNAGTMQQLDLVT